MITSSFMRVWYIMMILAFPTRFTNMIVRADNIMQNISASDGNLHADNFGLSVSVHNDNALVGAPRAVSDNNVEGGAVYVFTNMNGIWTQTAKLQPNIIGSSKQHRFGEGVSIYNNYALIGAPGYRTLQTPITGVAYIFAKSNGSWTQEAQLLPNDLVIMDNLGGQNSVSIYHEYALLGAGDYEVPEGHKAYIFEKKQGKWEQVAKLLPSDGLSNGFGDSVSIYNNYALIGAPSDDTIQNNAGAAYLFERLNGIWTQTDKLTLSDGSAGDQFGYTVSIYDQYALIGAPGTASSTGAAYIFEKFNEMWTETAKLLPNDFGDGIELGQSVSLYEQYALIGAQGAAYIFERINSSTWAQTAKLLTNDAAASDAFECSVSMNQNSILIGAQSGGIYLPSTGKAYMITNHDRCDASMVGSTDYHLVDYRWSNCTSVSPTLTPITVKPTTSTNTPTLAPTPSSAPSNAPSMSPSAPPTASPTRGPTRSPIECPYNTFRYNTLSECFKCDAEDNGYECKGDVTVNVAYGHWVSAHVPNAHNSKLSPLLSINDSYQIVSLPCPVGRCCANHTGCNYFNGYYYGLQSLCAANRNASSVTCSRCNDGYHELLGSSACGECNQTDYGLLSLLFIIALLFTLFLLFILARPTRLLLNITDTNKEINWRKLIVYDRKSLVIVLIFKIYLYYYQGLSQILSIKNITPTSQFERTVLTLFNFDLSVLSISPQNGICFIAGIQSGIYELLISYIWYVFVAVNVVIIGCVWRCLCIQRNISCTPYLKTGSLHIILMTAGSLLSTSFKFLTCIKFVDGKYYHFYDADIACYGYVWWVAGMVPVLILCGMLMGLWFIMYKQGASEREKESHAYWSLSKRFRHKMWYWEFVLFIRRLGIAAFTSFYALADRMSGILLGSFIIILFALQARFNPFKHQRANLIESLCLFATASIVIVLLVMKEGSIGISVYLTFLIVAPLCIVCAIIADIVYKWYTFQDASTQQQNDAYRYLKQ
eukprot:124981_1